MAKIDIKTIKRNAIKIFDTKAEMLESIRNLGFKDDDRLVIIRKSKKWLVKFER